MSMPKKPTPPWQNGGREMIDAALAQARLSAPKERTPLDAEQRLYDSETVWPLGGDVFVLADIDGITFQFDAAWSVASESEIDGPVLVNLDRAAITRLIAELPGIDRALKEIQLRKVKRRIADRKKQDAPF